MYLVAAVLQSRQRRDSPYRAALLRTCHFAKGNMASAPYDTICPEEEPGCAGGISGAFLLKQYI